MSTTRNKLPSPPSTLIGRVIAMVLLAATAVAANAEQHPVTPGRDDPQRTARAEAFEIVDNVYFVGARLHLPSYLFTTPEGHILFDTTFDEYVPEIVENIESLGFSIDDVKIILASHAHHDHVGGHATMRELTRALTYSTARDKDVIESGGKTDFRDGGTWAPAIVDRVIEDGSQVRLGDVVLTAHLTPGHTKGCTTWTTVVEDNGRPLNLAILGGVRVNTNERLVGNPEYPEMAEDFAYTFARLKVLPVDLYLGAHGYWFNLERKRAMLEAGAEINPFIDPEGYQSAIRFWENQYLDRLREETHGNAD
jgi:metallo-beta-lactamase class B